jgi:hypothetical protein
VYLYSLARLMIQHTTDFGSIDRQGRRSANSEKTDATKGSASVSSASRAHPQSGSLRVVRTIGGPDKAIAQPLEDIIREADSNRRLLIETLTVLFDYRFVKKLCPAGETGGAKLELLSCLYVDSMRLCSGSRPPRRGN